MLPRKYRSAITVGIDLFLLFAIVPFVAGLRIELNNLRETVREQQNTPAPAIAQETPAPAPVDPEPEEIVSERPDLAEIMPAPEPALTVEAMQSEDPFISEARRRALEDPEAAMLWVQMQATGPERLRGMLEVVALWAADDSQNALLWLESNAQGLARIETLYSGMDLWSRQDPAAASEWILGMANDGSKITASKALVTNWVQKDPVAAAVWVNAIEPGNLRNETASALVDSWMEADPESATIWAMAEAEFHGDKAIMQSAIANYTAKSPRLAEAFLRNTSGAADAPGALESYVESYAKRYPDQAAKWYDALPEYDRLYDPNHAEILMREWSRTDSVAASGWLNEIPSGGKRDAAIKGFTETMMEFEPVAAVAWSNQISDPVQRTETLKNSIIAWSKQAPQEALEWVNSNNLAPDIRRSLASEIGAD
ncbi:MAG: hypothetical protein AAGC73_01210 [Verrucomicrobiota bacterium]